jgi:hypothetical protein
MPDASILLNGLQPANPRRSIAESMGLVQSAIDAPAQSQLLGAQVAGAGLDNEYNTIRNKYADQNFALTNQANQQTVDREKSIADLRNAAPDAYQIGALLDAGQPERAKVHLANRIKMLTEQGRDPSDSIAIMQALEAGDLDLVRSELKGVVDTATRAGLFGQDSQMTDYQRESLELQRMRLDAETGDPSAVREFKYFSGLSEDQKKQYLLTKRAGSYFDQGDVRMLADPITNTAEPVQAPGENRSQAEIQQILTGQAGVKKGTEAAATAAITESSNAIEKLSVTKQSIANIDEAIAAIDDGAQTGVIYSMLPSVKSASIALDNVRGKMGLDVIGGTTFGALSESELKFALDTALPQKLEPPELKTWLTRKKQAQQKLATQLEDAAIYLGKPGNTPAGYMEKLRNSAGSGQQTAAPKARYKYNPQTRTMEPK